MSVKNLYSAILTNRDAIPTTLTDPMVSGGMLQEAQGFVSSVSGDDIASKYRFCQIPSNCKVSQVLLSCGALSTSAAIDIGLYYPTDKSGTAGVVLDADFFSSAVDVSGALKHSDVTNESGTYTIAKQEMPIWQAAGLTSDPGGMLDVVGTLTAASAGSVDIGVKVRYVLG